MAHILIFVAMGIALDWAFFWRAHNMTAAFWSVDTGFDYKALLFLRVFLTAFASGIVGWGAMMETPSVPLIVIGAALFMASYLYAEYRLWVHGRSKR